MALEKEMKSLILLCIAVSYLAPHMPKEVAFVAGWIFLGLSIVSMFLEN